TTVATLGKMASEMVIRSGARDLDRSVAASDGLRHQAAAFAQGSRDHDGFAARVSTSSVVAGAALFELHRELVGCTALLDGVYLDGSRRGTLWSVGRKLDIHFHRAITEVHLGIGAMGLMLA